MAGDTDNPRIWINADVFVADLDTEGPDDIDTAWLDLPGWEALGLLSEDGAEISHTGSSDDKFAWGGIYIRTTFTKNKQSIKVAALEDNPVVQSLVNPLGSAESAGGVTTRHRFIFRPVAKAIGLELVDGDVTRRLVIPHGLIVDPGSEKFSDGDITGRELTINFVPDATGEYGIEITDDPQADEGS